MVQNKYDIAHIYPLNPSEDEEKLLANEERLSNDVNDIRNLIALCKESHTEFDKPRTVDDYRRIIEVKKAALARTASQEKWSEFKLQDELHVLVKSLLGATPAAQDAGAPLSYDPKTLDTKVGSKLTEIVKKRVQYEITTYYLFLRDAFRTIERSNSASAQQILLQVRGFYLEQTKLDVSHSEVLRAVADWIQARSGASREAASILASFFVQNCEVF